MQKGLSLLYPFRHRSYRSFIILVTGLALIIAACGSDDTDDAAIESASESDPTPTAVATAADEPTATAEPEAVEPDPEATDDSEPDAEPDPEPTEPPAAPTPEPAPDVDLAPELAGLTDWRNGDPVTLEDLRGEPVVLVFWNSI